MDASDIVAMNERLTNLYGERFPPLRPFMAEVWLEALKDFNLATIHQAISTWTEEHTFWPPTLKQMLAQAIATDDTQSLERTQRSIAHEARNQIADFSTVLADLADRSSMPVWAHCHIELFLAGATKAGNEEQAAQLCEDFAERYPDLAAEWRVEAAKYRQEARENTMAAPLRASEESSYEL